MFCETVVLLSQQKPDDTIEIDLDLEVGCNQCWVESSWSDGMGQIGKWYSKYGRRTCAKRIGVDLKRGKLLRELLAVYKINSVGDLL